MNAPDYDKIIDNLYLGNLESTKDYKFLYLNNIKYILSLTQNEVRLEPKKYKHIHFNVKDAPYEDLISLFDICNSFINEALNNNFGILVHCDMGISRSATIVIAYLMKRRSKSFNNIFQYVKFKRPIINPNFGFQAQLLLFDKLNNRYNNYIKLYKQFLINDNTTGEQHFDVKNYIQYIVNESKKPQNIGGKNVMNKKIIRMPTIPYNNHKTLSLQTLKRYNRKR